MKSLLAYLLFSILSFNSFASSSSDILCIDGNKTSAGESVVEAVMNNKSYLISDTVCQLVEQFGPFNILDVSYTTVDYQDNKSFDLITKLKVSYTSRDLTRTYEFRSDRNFLNQAKSIAPFVYNEMY